MEKLILIVILKINLTVQNHKKQEERLNFKNSWKKIQMIDSKVLDKKQKLKNIINRVDGMKGIKITKILNNHQTQVWKKIVNYNNNKI